MRMSHVMSNRLVSCSILWTLLLTGCASVKPTASVELMYALPFSADYWVHQDRSWTCEPPQFRLEAGGEHKSGWEAGFYHESFLLCGSLNRKPEIYENGIYLKKNWGGW